MLRATMLGTFLVLASFVAGCAADGPSREEKGSTTSRIIGGACSESPGSDACAGEEEDNARRDEQIRQREEPQEPQEPAIELDEEWLDCESYESCVG